MLNDKLLAQAVSQIIQRAERQPDDESLERTYVDAGVLPQLDNLNNQILFGRRGTGKSHVLRVLGLRRRRDSRDLAAYVDMRMLGSALSAADPGRPLATRSVNVFKDLLVAVYDELLDAATSPDRDASNVGIDRLSEFGDAITAVARVTQSRSVSQEHATKATATDKIRAGLKGLRPEVGAELGGSESDESRIAQTFTEVFENNLVFMDVFRTLERALAALGVANLYLLLDEWAGVPPELQPIVAEFLKRGLMPSTRVTIKVASLEYRSRLSSPLGNNAVVGFEVGGDISAILDLDDYYVYDRNPEQVVDAFEELLYRHVDNELPRGHFAAAGIQSSQQFRQRLFSERETFVELVRASEGVVRDFINIFNAAFFDSKRRGRNNIDVKAVREAARKWYETDKSVNLTPEQQEVLNRIITEVIGNKRSRSFLLPRDLSRHPMIQSLFDFRVLHLMSKGYSDKDNPGVRYNIYNLDYGTYVDLIQTKKEPALTLGLIEDREPEPETVVPFDDKRSIRRIVVDRSVLTGS